MKEQESKLKEMSHCPQCGAPLTMHPKQKLPHCADCHIVFTATAPEEEDNTVEND